MSNLVVPANSTPQAEQDIVNDGWFPNVKPADFRASMRADMTVTAERSRDALITAILSVNRELTAWKVEQVTAGKASLEAVDAAAIDGKKAKVHLYLVAVFSHAKAQLVERYPDYDATKSGVDKADHLTTVVDDYRRDLRFAISDIQGKARRVVELI